MLFAAFEIVIFLLVATLLGAAAGWSLACARKVGVTRAMDRSGAHAAADRELEIARAEITRLNSKLRVAADAIRELEGSAAPSNGEMRDLHAIPKVPAAPPELDDSHVAEIGETVSDGADTHSEAVAEDEAEFEVEGFAAAPDDENLAELEAAVDSGAQPDAGTEFEADSGIAAGDPAAAGESAQPVHAGGQTSTSPGGRRLARRVADAESAANSERPGPRIRFDDPSD
jgi:hypothetical protein